MAELFTILGIIITVLLGDVFVCALVTLAVYDYTNYPVPITGNSITS